ncbi:MAG TPA: 30S ribosomal protein S9 [Oligoflexia bacterium]|nr:30S ribosomal protein S9 [Oligoflexia bacterium]HMP27172.1 30S ribosomal protein S9 [Oligoflexia bacterium]
MKTAQGVLRVGRRKTAIARVQLMPGNGEMIVNGMSLESYFGRKTSQMIVNQPLVLLDVQGRYNAKIKVVGGGKSGQAEAIRLGISRALLEFQPDARKTLRSENLLTRDARKVERKKYGKHKARKRPQYSKR